MKKILFFLMLLLFINCSKNNGIFFPENEVNSPKIEIIKSFGGSKNDSFQSIVNTLDGGYAILGHTQSNDFDIADKTDDSFDFWVLKFSADDSLLWSKTFGGSEDDRGADLIATNDGGFALFGYSKSNDGDVTENNGDQDFWILKITANGVISWQKTFGFSGADTGYAITQTNDNGFLLTGVLDVSASGGQGNKTVQKHAGGDIWAIKLDASGNKQWQTYYGGSFTDTPLGVVKTNDNGFIIAASSDSNDFNISNNKGQYDFWILKINANGTLIWEKNLGGSEIEEPRGICQTNDGNFMIVGDTRSNDKDVYKNNGAADLWVIKITPDGNLLWEKTFGGSSFDAGRAIFPSQNGGFLIAGNSRSENTNFTNLGQNDGWILKIDDLGNQVW
ncbi:MAG: hypothetical protein NWQ17_10265, partial [Polaribacter sp.]|nr:hypothetical protein [Polaribacter sp.]